jgi:hypothetical protein
MFPIATFTVTGSSTDTIDLTSIPQTFTHLQVRVYWNVTNTATGDYILAMTFNGDTYPNTSYSMHYINGQNTTASAGSEINNWNATIGDLGKYGSSVITPTTSAFSSVIADVLDYTSTNKNKTVRSLSVYENGSQSGVNMFSSARLNTAAVTSLRIWRSGSSGFFLAGTRIDLYGIAASNATGV